MTGFPVRLLACLAIALSLAGCAASGERGPVVLAAASMQEALTEVADAWAGQGHSRPVLSFAATSSLARQAEAGAPADIFVSADQQWMDRLEAEGLVDGESRRDVVGNSLVFVVDGSLAGEPPTIVNGLPDIGDRLAMADPVAVPAGRYARAALEEAGLWETVAPRVVPAENVRAALALVERGEVPVGIVYASDAHASNAVTTLPFPHPLPADLAITYPAARLTASRHAEAAPFLAFLSSEQAQAIFCSHGFTKVDEPC